MVRIGCNCVRHKFVARRWLLVARKKSSRSTIKMELEANLNASCGRGVSGANGSDEWPASESYCAMNKERVGCNGCEAVSTLSDSDRGEGVKVPTS